MTNMVSTGELRVREKCLSKELFGRMLVFRIS